MFKILKIGGSVLTYKNELESPKHEAIERMASEIAGNSHGLIMIHGAGSFGHIHAKKFGLLDRINAYGLLATHTSVVKLNSLIVDALSRAEERPMPVHPFSCILLKDGRIERMEITPIIEMVKRGMLPVLHGDVVMDESRGSGIVSGDQLVSYLGKVLSADIVALGTKADGVMLNGRSLDRVTKSDLARIKFDSGEGVDVTGGMEGKLLELIDLAECGIESQIFNAEREGLIGMVLKGAKVGTVIGKSNQGSRSSSELLESI